MVKVIGESSLHYSSLKSIAEDAPDPQREVFSTGSEFFDDDGCDGASEMSAGGQRRRGGIAARLWRLLSKVQYDILLYYNHTQTLLS